MKIQMIMITVLFALLGCGADEYEKRTELTEEESSDELLQVVGGNPVAASSAIAKATGMVLMEGGGACTATLIHSRWMLTAGHCAVGSNRVRVRFGTNFRSPELEVQGTIYRHPQYVNQKNANGSSTKVFYDFAVIKLDTNVNRTKASLPTNSSGVYPGFRLHFAGFGNRKISNNTANDIGLLYSVKLTADSYRSGDLSNPANVQRNYICATGGFGSAFNPKVSGVNSGDSGGPAFKDGTLMIAGVNAFNSIQNGGSKLVSCASRIEVGLPWIKQMTGIGNGGGNLGGGSTEVMGHIDSVSRQNNFATAKGWACVQGLAQSITIHIYVGGPYGQGQFIGSARANISSEAGVSNVCKTSRVAHRFEVKGQDNGSFKGKALYIYGINPVNGKPNKLIGGSGKMIP